MRTDARTVKGILVSIVGMLSNLLLSSAKIGIGIISGSIAILLDGMNNFVDIFSSGATALCFGISRRERDENYSNGYGRVEYIISFLIAIITLLVGLAFAYSSIERLLLPEIIRFSWAYLLVLLPTVLIKLIMAYVYSRYNKRYESLAIKSLKLDSFNDAIITAAIIASFIASNYIAISLDAVCGIIIALLIIYNSSKQIRVSYRALMGTVDSKLYHSLYELIIDKEHIIGIDDLRIHNYGHDEIYADVEVVIKGGLILEELLSSNEIIKQEAFNKYNINLKISIKERRRQL